MELDALLLSRIHFALTVGFHFLFPPLSIGLAWLLVFIEWNGWKRDDPAYQRAGVFFGRVLGLTFAVGVATGIVMEFQFGTNWAEYSRFVGDIFGAPLAAEAVLAFFLESTFLGLYLFGRNRISKGFHWFSILMVAVGSALSAFWIIVANSWQQTPAGYIIQNGRAELTNFYEAVFNPSTLIRFSHVMVASFIAGAFLMAGISAWLLLKKKHTEVARRSLKAAVIFGFIFSVMSLLPTGHEHTLQVYRTQPEKFAAFEGIVEGSENMPLIVLGVPSEEPRQVNSLIELPGLISLLLGGSTDTYVKGLEDYEAEGHPTPPFAITFLSYHTMVILGMIFIGITALGVLLLLLKRLDTSRWYLAVLPWLIPLPLIACEVGWIVAEVGRQPWVVYRMLRTDEAYSFNVSGAEVLSSIIMFSLIYLLLGIIYVFLLVRKVKAGPDPLPVATKGEDAKEVR